MNLWKLFKIHIYVESQNVIFRGNRVSAIIIKEVIVENPWDGGAWWAAIYGVAQSQTRLKRLSSRSRDEQRDDLTVLTSVIPGGSDSKESTCNAGDLGSIPGLRRSPEGKGYPLQYSGLENSMDSPWGSQRIGHN